MIKMQFDPTIAKAHGTDTAIIYANIQYWVEKNQANEKHFHEGRYWTYNSIDAFNKMFNYLSESQIRRCLKKLINAKLIVTGNYNKHGYDRTKWYTCLTQNEQMHMTKSSNAFEQTDKTIPNDKHKYKTHIQTLHQLLGNKGKLRVPSDHVPKLKLRLKHFTMEEIEQSAFNISKDDYMIKGKYNTVEYLLRNNHNVEKYLNKETKEVPKWL